MRKTRLIAAVGALLLTMPLLSGCSSPPDPQVARDFDVLWDMSYWGTTSRIYATFGRGTPSGLLSKWMSQPF